MNSTTIVTNPNYLSPLNNLYGNYFILDNVDSNATNFKYLTKLYYRSNDNYSGTLLTQDLQPPRPGSGQGIFSPYKALESILTYDLNNEIAVPTGGDATSDLVNYYIQYGFKYSPNLEITRLLQVATASTASGYFGLSFSSAHGFNVGDLIRISSNNPYLSGTATINGLFFNTTSFSIDKVFTTASNISAGSVIDLERINATSSNFYGYNGRRQYANLNTNYYNSLVMGTLSNVSSSKPFLTDYLQTDDKPIMLGQDETLSFFIHKVGFISRYRVIYNYYNSSNTLLSTFTLPQTIGSGTLQKWDIPVGTNFLSATGSLPASTDKYTITIKSDAGLGTGAIFIVNTAFSPTGSISSGSFVSGGGTGGSGYSVGDNLEIYGATTSAIFYVNGVNSGNGVTTGYFLSRGTGFRETFTYSTRVISPINATYSEVRTFRIDTDCSLYDNVRIMWLNSYGVFDYFNFRKDNKKTINTQKTEIKKPLPIPFTMGSRERTIISSKITETHTINTDWITENQFTFLGGIIQSPEVYIIDELTGNQLPIIVDDTTYEYKTQLRDRLFNLTLNYTYAYTINTQRG